MIHLDSTKKSIDLLGSALLFEAFKVRKGDSAKIDSGEIEREKQT